MKHLCLGLLLGFVLQTSLAHAQSIPEDPILPSVSDLEHMTPQERTIYIEGLQSLVVEIEDIEMSRGSEFAKTKLFCAEGDREPAEAAAAPGPCVYAGYLQTRDAVSNLCPRLPRGSCGPDQVQCNAQLFGTGVCTTPGRHATLLCFQRSKPMADILKLHTYAAAWTDFTNKLKTYCDDGKQPEICRLVQKRVRRLNGDVAESSAPEGTVTPASETSPRGAKAPKAPHLLTAREVAVQQNPELGLASTWTADQRRRAGMKDACDPFRMINAEPNMAPLHMTYAEVYNLMCTKSDADVRAMRMRIGRPGDPLQVTINGRRQTHFDTSSTSFIQNMDKCLAEAEYYRASQKPLVSPTVVVSESYDMQNRIFKIHLSKSAHGLKADYIGGDSQNGAEEMLTADLQRNGLSICAAKPAPTGPGSQARRESAPAHVAPVHAVK